MGEEQQAASELQQDLHNIKQQAAATDASRQHVQQQLEMTKQQLLEKEQTLTDMADQLDALTSAVAAKEGSIQLLQQQVLCLPACCICPLCLTFSASRSNVCLVHACIMSLVDQRVIADDLPYVFLHFLPHCCARAQEC